MKRIAILQSINFRPLTMVGGDLLRLIELLAPCQDVRIVADDVEYDSVSEFLAESKGKSPNSMKISAREPYLIIEFSNFSARMYVSTSDIKGAGIFAQLVALIQSCERKPKIVYSYWYAVASTLVIQAAFTLPMLSSIKYFQIWLVIANTIWIGWVFYIQLRRFSVIQPVGAQDLRTFWQRNSDSVIIAVFSALLGALVGAAATKVADRIWPSLSTTNSEANERATAQKAPVATPSVQSSR